MVERTKKRKQILKWILAFTCFFFPHHVGAQTVELACPAGQWAIPVGDVTNQGTGKLRHNLCVDLLGNINWNGNFIALLGANAYACRKFGTVRCIDSNNSAGWVPPAGYSNDVSGWIAAATLDILNSGLSGGTIDARGTSGNNFLQYNHEIDVGASPGPFFIHLIVPCAGVWGATNSSGNQYALKVFTNSSVTTDGCSSGFGNPFYIRALSGSNLDSVCGNDFTSTGGTYVRMSGFTCDAAAGSTVISAVGHFKHLVDEAYVGHLTLSSESANASKVLWVHGTNSTKFSCCSATLEFISSSGTGVAGVQPCFFGNGTTDANSALAFRNSTCTQAGDGISDLIIQQNGFVGHNKYENIYMEKLAGSDLTAPFVSLQAFASPTASDKLEGITPGVDIAGSTRYTVDIASGARALLLDIATASVSPNAINDHNAGGTTISPGGALSVPLYTTETPFFPNLGLQNQLVSKFGISTLGGFCTSPSTVFMNSSFTFRINVGTACAASTGTINFVASAKNNWNCFFSDITNPAGNLPRQTGGTSNSVTLTNFNAAGAATNFTSSDVISGACWME